MVVDDDTVDRESIIRHLGVIGQYDVVDVSTAKECYERITKEHFDLLLLDFYLSDSDCLDLIFNIRQSGFTSPIIIITGLGDEILRNKLRVIGVEDYIPKDKLSPQLLNVTITFAMENHNKKMQEMKKLQELQLQLKEMQDALDKKLAEHDKK